MKGPFAHHGIEGPTYADRVNGRLTFRDWKYWTPEDQAEWRAEYREHLAELLCLAGERMLDAAQRGRPNPLEQPEP
jgi:hypothetical protein